MLMANHLTRRIRERCVDHKNRAADGTAGPQEKPKGLYPE
jgi:hypothetical protein